MNSQYPDLYASMQQRNILPIIVASDNSSHLQFRIFAVNLVQVAPSKQQWALTSHLFLAVRRVHVDPRFLTLCDGNGGGSRLGCVRTVSI